MIPYPVVAGDYWANAGFWWIFEFWNRSVEREAGARTSSPATPPGSFPKLALKFDPRTGRANIDPDAFVAQAVGESRFHVGRHCRRPNAASLSTHPNGPGAPTGSRLRALRRRLDPARTNRPHPRLRDPGQNTSVERALTRDVGGRHVPIATFRPPLECRRMTAPRPSGDGVQPPLTVCVPARGFADVTMRVAAPRRSTAIQTPSPRSSVARQGGVQFQPDRPRSDELGAYRARPGGECVEQRALRGRRQIVGRDRPGEPRSSRAAARDSACTRRSPRCAPRSGAGRPARALPRGSR